MKYPKFKVCCKCFTFNQSKLITDTMDGFCMQETNFPFVCTIVDDASTDGEQEVINKYLDEHFNLTDQNVAYKKETDYAHIAYAQHNENKNCFFAVIYLKENLYSRNEGFKKIQYISEWRTNCEFDAWCEGDDYWVTSNKLQQQVNYLENHNECALVYTKAQIYLGSKCSLSNNTIGQVIDSDYGLLVSNPIPTLTVCCRRELVDQYHHERASWTVNWKMGDYPLWIWTSMFYKIHFINEVTGVYRVLEGTASRGNYETRVAFVLNAMSIAEFFIEKYDINCNRTVVLDSYIRQLFCLSLQYRKKENIKTFFTKIKKKSFKDYVRRYFFPSLFTKYYSRLH